MRVGVVESAAVRQDAGIAEYCISVVDVAVVHAARVVPGMERLVRTAREPANAATKAPAKPKAESSTEEAHKRGATNGISRIRTWAPAPAAADRCPTTVVVGCKTPGCRVHPGPSPRADVAPVTVAVGRPAGCNLGGIPDRTVVRLLVPAPVII